MSRKFVEDVHYAVGEFKRRLLGLWGVVSLCILNNILRFLGAWWWMIVKTILGLFELHECDMLLLQAG